jgi:hypothetical protein
VLENSFAYFRISRFDAWVELQFEAGSSKLGAEVGFEIGRRQIEVRGLGELPKPTGQRPALPTAGALGSTHNLNFSADTAA